MKSSQSHSTSVKLLKLIKAGHPETHTAQQRKALLFKLECQNEEFGMAPARVAHIAEYQPRPNQTK